MVVAADSRFSKIRSKMGISAYTSDFNKSMIVCRMKHEKPHKNIAYEFFRYKQTQATLPYTKNQSGIVTTANSDLTAELMEMDNKNFNKEIQNSFGNFFGKMKLLGKRYSYPMITTYTKKFVSHRFALIGDAAVGMHPVTAHGFNLNLKGLEINLNYTLLFIPLLLLQVALLGLGFGMLLSALTSKYRDLTFVMSFGVQLWMYATPIVYPLSIVPEKYKLIFALNPMTSIVESFRYIFYQESIIDFKIIIISLIITLLISFFGLLFFNKTEKNILDTV